MLNVQLQYLSAQLRPLLHHYVVHPKSVNQTNAPILPIMLASKLLPEQDAERDALMSGSRLSPEECAQQTATLNAIIDGLTLGGGVLDTKGPTRVRMAAAVKAAMAEGAAPQAQQQDPGEHGPMVHGPRGQQAAPLGGRDLLAAASYGAGLT